MAKILKILFWFFALVIQTLSLLSRISDKGIKKANMLDWLQLIFIIVFIGILIGLCLSVRYGKDKKI